MNATTQKYDYPGTQMELLAGLKPMQFSPMTFAQWQAFARNIGDRAKRVQASKHEQGWKLAASVGIDRNLCCVHNAAIDDDMKGWCFQNPHRLKVAKKANWILNDWTVSNLAERITRRAWDRVQWPSVRGDNGQDTEVWGVV